MIRPLGIKTVRRQAEIMETETRRFYERAAGKVSDASTRQLLGDLAEAERKHMTLAEIHCLERLCRKARKQQGKPRCGRPIRCQRSSPTGYTLMRRLIPLRRTTEYPHIGAGAGFPSPSFRSTRIRQARYANGQCSYGSPVRSAHDSRSAIRQPRLCLADVSILEQRRFA